MESILISIKKLLGITEEYTSFDQDIIIHINSVMAILAQLGVGPAKGFHITGATEKWNDFIPEDVALDDVKSYIYIKVKMLFDPPLSSAVIESTNRLISELEWRINVAAESKKEEEK